MESDLENNIWTRRNTTCKCYECTLWNINSCKGSPNPVLLGTFYNGCLSMSPYSFGSKFNYPVYFGINTGTGINKLILLGNC